MRNVYRILSAFAMLSILFPPTGLGNELDPELRARVMLAVDKADSFEDRFDAEVWLKLNSGRLEKYVDDENERLQILVSVHREAVRWNIKPELVLAVIDVESAFNKYALSRVYARGLMQVMPFWADELGMSAKELMEIDTNVRIGCAILAHYLEEQSGDYVQALSRYNGTTDRKKYADIVLYRLTTRWYE